MTNHPPASAGHKENSMTTTAQAILSSSKSAADVLDRATAMKADADQDWENETTVFTFEDGSKAWVSATEFDVRNLHGGRDCGRRRRG
jgi:hypothetical protein